MSVIATAQALWLLVAALGLSLSVSYAGMPILGQSAFVAVGGYGTALFGPGGLGMPLGVAVMAAILAGSALGRLTAVGLSRLGGAYLALATWTLGWLVQRALLAYPGVFGGPQGIARRVPMHLVSRTLGVQIVLTPWINLAVATALCALVLLALIRLGRGLGGLEFAALRDAPQLARLLGTPLERRRSAMFTITAALGAVAGAGMELLNGLVSPTDVSPLLSLQLFVAVLLAGAGRWWGPVLGVALISTLPTVASTVGNAASIDPQRLRGVLTAVLLLGVLIVRRALLNGARRTAGLGRPVGELFDLPAPQPTAGLSDVKVRVSRVSVFYADLAALDEVSIELRGGQVHAVVGPNGSGKSTLLDVLAGVNGPNVLDIGGRSHRSRSVRDRVLAGVVRTPQRIVNLEGMTPAMQIGLGARGASQLPAATFRQLLATPRSRLERERTRVVVSAALERTGLQSVADADPAQLTIGEQQLLQVARAIATGASVFLFDEPAAGMGTAERAALATVLRELAATGAAVAVVEHDMRFVGRVADYVTVLDAGRVIASGPPAQVRREPLVREAYLGSPEY